MDLDHLNEMRKAFIDLEDEYIRSYMILADRFGQDLLIHMLARLFAESFRGLSRQEIAHKLAIKPELTDEEKEQVKDSLYKGVNIPQDMLEV